MSTREFAGWRYHYKRFPFDDESVHQASLALLMSIYVNANRGKDGTPMPPSDFLPFLAARTKSTEADSDMLDFKFRAWAARAPTATPDVTSDPA